MKDRAFAAAALLYLAAPALTAQPSTSPISGSVTLGTRTVDLSGATTKYREDINLDDGVRLFDVALSYRSEDSDAPVDDVTFSASHLGGDPFESVQLSVRKFGAYRLRLDRRRSDYFYEDTILPAALASVSGSTGGDFHHFDFERVRDSALLEIELSPSTELSFGLERQTRQGESTTTLDIQRDEFELDRPLDETLEALRFGIEHGRDRWTLVFEEEVRDFRNTNELVLPGASPGQNTTTNPAELQFFFLDQAVDYDSHSHVLRAIANPTERLDISSMWRREDVDLDLEAAEQSLGTTFGGSAFSTDLTGTGQAERDSEIVAVDLGFSFDDRARLIAGARTSTLDQRGHLAFGPDLGTGDWDVETDGFELGAEVALGPRTVITAGWSTESRDAHFEHLENGAGTTGQSSTDRDGYFARFLHTTDGGLEVSGSIEDNSIDDPYALAAPSDSQRYRIRLRYAFANGVGIQGSHQRTDVENTASGWIADTEQSNLRMNYSRPGLNLSIGTSRIDMSREISQLVTGGSIEVLFPILYGADARLHDVSVRGVAFERFTLGGRWSVYDNRGSFPLDRDDNRIYAEMPLSDAYQLILSYRDVDFGEDAFDAYDAKILELGLRLDW